jgi:predicted nucleic acid binding AN1-type Zn finger protein
MSLVMVLLAADAGNITLSPFSGTPELSQPDQFAPFDQTALAEPSQVQVSAAATAVGIGISNSELKATSVASDD